jgi:hypothetical protein
VQSRVRLKDGKGWGRANIVQDGAVISHMGTE